MTKRTGVFEATEFNTVRILSLDGGGILGLATAAFLAECEQHFQVSTSDQFDLFCGTSTGAIIAAALANGMSGHDVLQLYRRLGPAVFPSGKMGRNVRWLLSFVRARYGNSVLREILDEAFGEATLDSVGARNKKLMITAFSLTSGAPRVFKTDHAPGLTRHGRYRLADVVLASSAAPTYFPIVELLHPDDGSREQYCDGGVAANNPAMLGYAEALRELEVPADRISLLSISTPREPLSEVSIGLVGHRRNRGVLSWASKLSKLFTSAPSTLTDGALDRIARAAQSKYQRVSLSNPHCLALDDASEGARTALERIGRDHAAQGPSREKMKIFFAADSNQSRK